MAPSVLIVDDEVALAAAIETFLTRQGLPARAFGSAEAALAALDEIAPDIALLDLQLPGMDGIAALQSIKRARPETLVVLMTAYSSISGAVAAMKSGADDYLTKPLDLDELLVVLQRAWKSHRLRGELEYLRRRAGHTVLPDALLGTSLALGELRRHLLQVASADRLGEAGPTVLITGETGTGKQLAARAIHAAGPRARGPFVEINCAAIPATLLEGELFGVERGAYTDARTSKPGLFETADGGTLFLDEIGLMDVALQAKLLKVIEDHVVRRLGALAPRPFDARVLAATNRDLEAAVREGTFRADLFYRLHVLTVDLPPLRGRDEDIELLVSHFLEETRSRYSLGDVHLSPSALKALRTHSWPGNVRELQHVIERAALLYPGRTLEPQHFDLTRLHGAQIALRSDGVSIDFSRGSIDIDAVERELISRALTHTRWNRADAAELLGLTKATLRYRIEKFGLSPDR